MYATIWIYVGQTFASCNIFLGNFFKCVFFQVALMISVGQ